MGVLYSSMTQSEPCTPMGVTPCVRLAMLKKKRQCVSTMAVRLK